MSKEPRIYREIKGEPYSFERNAHGYGVTNTSAPENNFYRSYQVYLGSKGVPTHCSCPDCYYKLRTSGLLSDKSNWCKHMRAVDAIVSETLEPDTFLLINPRTGWRFTYRVFGGNRTIITADRDGWEFGTVLTGSRDEGREHYKQKWREGFRPPSIEK